jgi:lauroyl/myristoyl acyltransferase
MNDASVKNLSASRGNRFGIGFFRLLLRCGAFGFALWFSRIVTWFYARFDRRAFAATEEYLKLRFPEDAASERRLKRHFHRLLNELAKTLLISYRMGIGETLPLEEEHPEFLPEHGGVVAVLSHYDCWQSAMELMHRKSGRRINIMASPDRNGNMDKFLALKEKNGFGVISTDGFSGGLVEASAALERGEAVIIMGDRPVEGTATVEVDYLGGKLAVPLSPWMLAARNQVPALPVFTELEEAPLRIVIRYRRPIVFQVSGERRIRTADLMPGVERYVRELEDAARRRPYRVFRFGDAQTNQK